MRYVNFQRRREEHGKYPRHSGDPLLGPEIGPYLSAVVVIAVVAVWFALTFLCEDGLLAALVMLALILAIPLARAGRGLKNRGLQGTSPKVGGEKQLLMVLREAGSITPVQAALETSLLVDEAEDILSHLANRGHLHVESRHGAIYYVLPGAPSSHR